MHLRVLVVEKVGSEHRAGLSLLRRQPAVVVEPCLRCVHLVRWIQQHVYVSIGHTHRAGNDVQPHGGVPGVRQSGQVVAAAVVVCSSGGAWTCVVPAARDDGALLVDVCNVELLQRLGQDGGADPGVKALANLEIVPNVAPSGVVCRSVDGDTLALFIEQRTVVTPGGDG